MHSYQHNIKTFNHATRHLTAVERMFYRELIELYYDTEQPLPADDFDRLCRRVGANSDSEKTAVVFVLSEFFVLTGNVYSHDYCDEEIERYQNQATQKSIAGRASAEARKKKSAERKAKREAGIVCDLNESERVFNERSTAVHNQKPETMNHEPLLNTTHSTECLHVKHKKQKIEYTLQDVLSTGVDEQVAKDWLTVRKKKRMPLTQSIIVNMAKEAAKAGITIKQAIEICAAKGWAGFEAKYLDNLHPQERITFFEIATGQKPEF